MKKITIQEAFKQNDLEAIQNYIDIGFDFGTLFSTTWQYLTVESIELLQKNNIKLEQKDILNSSDKRVFDEMFAQDRDIFYKIFYKIVYHGWMDMYDWDWDVKRLFEKRMFLDVVEPVIKSNNIDMLYIMTDKLNQIPRTIVDSILYLKKYRDLEFDDKIFKKLIAKEKKILDFRYIEELIINGYLEDIEDVMQEEHPEINPLHLLIDHYLQNTMKVSAWDGVMEIIKDKDANIFIKYFESFKYDFDKSFKIQVYDRKAFKANGQAFSLTPLTFLYKYVKHKNKNKLINQALQKSENIFNNKIFRIARTYQRYNDEVLEFSGNYFETFGTKETNDIIFSRLNEEEFNKIKSETSKENLIKKAIKRDDFDCKNFAKWGFSPSEEFIDFLIKEIGEQKTKEYNLINIDDLVKNKDWCIEQLLDNNKSIIPKIDKNIVEDVIDSYVSKENANEDIVSSLLKEHINPIIRQKMKYEWDYISFGFYGVKKIDKTKIWQDVIEIIDLKKPAQMNIKTLANAFKYCFNINENGTKEKFEELSKANQNKIKDFIIDTNWYESNFGKYLVSISPEIIKKKDDILEKYLTYKRYEDLDFALKSGFEFKKSNGLWYYLAIVFRCNNDLDLGYAKRIETDDKNNSYYDIKVVDKLVEILLNQEFTNKKSIPANLKHEAKTNLMDTKQNIPASAILLVHLIYFEKSKLIEEFKNSFKSEWKKIMKLEGLGARKGNFMHYVIDISDKVKWRNLKEYKSKDRKEIYTKIANIIKDDVDENQIDRYKQNWEKFAQKQGFFSI
jgi:hypothetical protein